MNLDDWLRNHNVWWRVNELRKRGPWKFIKWNVAEPLAESLTNLIVYLPIIWRDRDFDHAFLLELLEFKLRRMAKLHQVHGHLWKSPRTAKELRYAAALCQRLRTDHYGYGWGVPDDEAFLRISNPDYPTFRWGKDSRTLAQRKRAGWAAQHHERLMFQDVEALTTLLRKHLLEWWD